MATVPITNLPSNISVVRLERWIGMLAGDTGQATPFAQYADRSVHVTGVFGAGGACIIEGSNDDGANWATLTDPQGNPLSFTAAAFEQIDEIAGLLRPRMSGGDGSTSVNVNLCMRTA